MSETIVCAVDDSEAAGSVLDTARWLAEAWPARLVVVHTVEDREREADEVLASIRARLAEEDPDVRLLRGSPAPLIMEVADEEGAELIVVGSRGRGSLRSAVLGSVSRELASEARCPVVVVPGAGGHGTAGAPGTSGAAGDGVGNAEPSVVCGVDGSDRATKAAAFAGMLARRLGCRTVIVHARQNLSAVMSYPGASSETPPATGQEDSVRELADEVLRKAEAAAGVSAATVAEPGPPVTVLESVATSENARLIVIAARGMGGLRAALLGSVASELPAAAARPVVVLSERAVAAPAA